MRAHIALVAALVGLAHAAPSGKICRRWTVGQVVNTTSGPVQGHAASVTSDVSEYLGIPYAQAPVGALRFQPPVAFTGSQLINGSSFGLSCMASEIDSGAGSPGWIEKHGVPPSGLAALAQISSVGLQFGEDCLSVNVWTKPQTGERAKAVIVFIYGGAFVTGSSAMKTYNGQYIADEEDVVVVTFNYRISLFGFPGSLETHKNPGMLDQHLAVEWVRDNIANFGGDPSRITLFGESAGGASVDYYSYAWATDPIAHAFSPMSGTATSFGAQTSAAAEAAWYNVSVTAGCGDASTNSNGAAGVFTCMQSKPAADIIAAIPPNGVESWGAALPYGPTVDEEVVFSDYTPPSRQPAARPMLIGNTDKEADLFRLFADFNETVLDYINQATFTCPTALRAGRSAGLWAPVNTLVNPTWRYRYFGVFPNLIISTKPYSRAWHGSELSVIFGTTPQMVLPNTPEQTAIGAYIRGAWAAFAKNPVSGLLTYGWPLYTPHTPSLIRLGYNNQTGANLATGNAYDVGCPAQPWD